MAPSIMLAAGSLLDADPDRLVAAAAEAGYDGIGMRLSADHHMDQGPRLAFARRVGQLGLRVHDVEVHRITRDDVSPGPLIDAAAEIGAAHLLVVSDLADWAETEERLGSLADQCRAAGVIPALEYMAWTLPSGPVDAIAFAEATGCVLVADLLHHHRVGAGPAELTTIVEAGHLGWVQLCDAPAAPPADLVDEARHHRLVPGEGELPLLDLLAVVPDHATISVEVQSDTLSAVYRPFDRAQLLMDAALTVFDRGRRS